MILSIIITVLLVLLNSFFVAAEFAIVKVRASQLELKVQAGNRFAKQAKHIVSHLDGYLAATQLGITLSSLGLGWAGEPVVARIIVNIIHLFGLDISDQLAHDIALPLAFALISILHIVFGELAPKSIAIQRSEKTALFIAYPLQFFYLLFKPFIWLLNGIANVLLKVIGISAAHNAEIHSSDELKYLVRQGRETGMIEESNYDIIKNAFDFSERTAKQIMVPRTQMVAIDIEDFNEEVFEKIIEESYSRIPCYDGDLDNVTGVVYLKDLLLKSRKKQKIVLSEIMRPIMIIPENKLISILLKDFQIKHQQIAVIVDEYGGTKGIVTMEDILEELVGEIQDEYDNEVPIVEKAAEKVYNIIASASMDDINDLLPHPIEKDKQYETLAGNLILRFGRFPGVNEKISFDDYEFTISKISKSSIILARARDLREDDQEN